VAAAWQRGDVDPDEVLGPIADPADRLGATPMVLPGRHAGPPGHRDAVGLEQPIEQTLTQAGGQVVDVRPHVRAVERDDQHRLALEARMMRQVLGQVRGQFGIDPLRELRGPVRVTAAAARATRDQYGAQQRDQGHGLR
jgi:hypothetical protein